MVGNDKPGTPFKERQADGLARVPQSTLCTPYRDAVKHETCTTGRPPRSLFSCVSRLPTPRSLLPIFVLPLLACTISPASAADGASQVWLISTRDMAHGCSQDASLQCLRYSRLDENCRWSPADAETFAATDDPATPTVVFLHGNRTDVGWAVAKGIFTYDAIRAAIGCRPMRYVIWSWPAERTCRRAKDDARLKADYCDVESYCLARWLDRLRPAVKVSLVGHSLGPRIITGALHLLAGGELAGEPLAPDTVAAWSGGKRNPVRAVLLAAAIDADCLAPGGSHDRALSLVDRMLITRNDCDRVLRFYTRIDDGCGPEAIGFVGPCGIGDAKNVAVLDLADEVGKIHDWRCYCTAASICCRWAEYTFGEE
jgi:hypothetical protein